MADLTNQLIANTYKDLLQVNAETANAGLDGTVRAIQDGGGTAGPISMSTAQLNVTGQFALRGTVLTATADQLNTLALGGFSAFTANDGTILLTEEGTSVSTATTSVTARINPSLTLTDLTTTDLTTTNLIVTTVTATGKVHGTTADFTGIVSIGTLDAGGLTYPTSAGNNGQVLQTNGSDTLSFVDAGAGGGFFKGDNGDTGDATTGPKDIFRINEQELNTNTVITTIENASGAGPITVASGVTLTINGNLTII